MCAVLGYRYSAKIDVRCLTIGNVKTDVRCIE